MIIAPDTLPALPSPDDIAETCFAALLGRLDYLSAADTALVREAYVFAEKAHRGQMRKNGDPYITHPIAVAAMCTEWKLDAQALMAALMHDVMEDCGISKQGLAERFGEAVANLVDGLTKLDKLEFDSREQNQAESFRKMLLAMAKDVRVMLIKLADRTHNMRTMADMPRSKWQRICSETLEIYAPIAYRLGLNFTYRELQDLSFRFLHPWRYGVVSKALSASRSKRRELFNRVQQEVENAFARHSMPVRVMSREKTPYSVYRKMDTKHLSFSQVTDIHGFRIVVPELHDCYTALGILHQLFKPVPGKFRDHVAIPKVNGYQSLHTTLIGPSGTNIEFQLRTHPMDVVAESGITAHWLYKATEPNSETSQRLGMQWLQSLLDIQQETRDASEFWHHIKIDLFPDAVYVFTPKSKIMSLPQGATVMDFAYAIHSGVGNRAVGARINGEQRPLRTELTNGDVVEIITDDKAEPNPAWLSFVKTGRARSKIRHHLKTMAHEKSYALGLQLLGQALRSEGFTHMPDDEGAYRAVWEKLTRFTGNKSRADLLGDIGMGKRIVGMVSKKLAALLIEAGLKPDPVLISTERYLSHSSNAPSQGVVTLDGSEGLSVQYAACCKPIPGDHIVGYLGRGEGLAVHTTECPVGKRLLMRDNERFLEVEWADEPQRTFETVVMVTVANGKGVLARVALALTTAEADITHVDMGEEPAQTATDIRFTLAVHNRVHLAHVLRNLKRTPSVLKAHRYRPARVAGGG